MVSFIDNSPFALELLLYSTPPEPETSIANFSPG